MAIELGIVQETKRQKIVEVKSTLLILAPSVGLIRSDSSSARHNIFPPKQLMVKENKRCALR